MGFLCRYSRVLDLSLVSVQRVAVEAIVHSASKKDRCTGILKDAVPILKNLYKSSDESIQVRALVVSFPCCCWLGYLRWLEGGGLCGLVVLKGTSCLLIYVWWHVLFWWDFVCFENWVRMTVSLKSNTKREVGNVASSTILKNKTSYWCKESNHLFLFFFFNCCFMADLI